MRYPLHWPDEHPEDPRIYVPNIEFYITNVCNIACPDCNRFNNHDFTGWQRWSDYEADYTAWADRIRLQRVTILGGEPLMNPDICKWIIGINQLWGKCVNVLTNGTRLNHTPGLYDAIMNYRKNIGNWIGVSVHNVGDLERHFEEARKFLKGPLKFWTRKEHPDRTWGADYAFEDANQVHVHYWIQDSFYPAAVQQTYNGKFTLHNSDPVLAHDSCGFAKFQCYHFIRAKLYKCGPVALFPEFDQQHHFDISDQDRDLVNNYPALGVDEFDSRGQQFINDIDDVIPQCKFCPVSKNNNSNNTIQSLNKVKNATSSFNIR